MLLIYFDKGDDATSIPSQCCDVPYSMNGHIYHNCTVNPSVNNDFGCYHRNKEWVTCQNPEGALMQFATLNNKINKIKLQLMFSCLY